MSLQPLIVICGPTGSGKTAMAIAMAKKIHGEIINADSRQIYEEIPIASGAPSEKEKEAVPHHLFGIRKISSPMNVAEYKIMTEACIDEILSRKKIPILCGGTHLWIDAVAQNYQLPRGAPDHVFRNSLQEKGVDELLVMLKKIDPISFEKLSISKNKRTIIRALEIFHLTGKAKSELSSKGPRKYEVLKFAPLLSREDLYRKLDERTKKQLQSGLIEEIIKLKDFFTMPWPGLTGIGCKEMEPYLCGKISKAELLRILQQHNRNYAKRQLTWLRKDGEIIWFSSRNLL